MGLTAGLLPVWMLHRVWGKETVSELAIHIMAQSLQWKEPPIRFEQTVGQWNRCDPDCHA